MHLHKLEGFLLKAFYQGMLTHLEVIPPVNGCLLESDLKEP
jgi:hypothetical protein